MKRNPISPTVAFMNEHREAFEVCIESQFIDWKQGTDKDIQTYIKLTLERFKENGITIPENVTIWSLSRKIYDWFDQNN